MTNSDLSSSTIILVDRVRRSPPELERSDLLKDFREANPPSR